MHNNQPQNLNQIMEQASTRAATAFGEMLNLPVTVQLSNADLLNWQAMLHLIDQETPNWGSAVVLPFLEKAQAGKSGGIQGESIFMLPAGSDQTLMQAVFEQIPDMQNDVDARQNILLEMGNVLLNACVGTVVNQLNKNVVYQTPQLIEPAQIRSFFNAQSDNPDSALWMRSKLGVGGLEVNAEIILIMQDSKI